MSEGNGTVAGKVADGRYRRGDQVVLVADGEEWILPGLDESDLDQVEAYIRENQRPALEAVPEGFDKLPETLREGLIDRIYRDMRKGAALKKVSRQDVGDWLDTTDGVVYSLWLQLKKRYPEITQEKVRRIIARVGIAEANKARDEASGDLIDLAAAKETEKTPA